MDKDNTPENQDSELPNDNQNKPVEPEEINSDGTEETREFQPVLPVDDVKQEETREFQPVLPVDDVKQTSQEDAFLPLDQEASQTSNNKKLHWTWGVVCVVLVAVCGFAVYSLQKDKADSQEQEAFKRGEQQGQVKVQAQYDKGGSGYNKIIEEGKKVGVVEGADNGREQGIAEGRKTVLKELSQTSPVELDTAPGATAPPRASTAARDGATFAWGGFTDWSDTLVYGVKFGEGEGSVPYQMIARMTFEPNKLYRICSDKPSLLCEVTLPEENGVPGETEPQGGVTDSDTEPSKPKKQDKTQKSNQNSTTTKKPKQPSTPELPLDPTDNSIQP